MKATVEPGKNKRIILLLILVPLLLAAGVFGGLFLSSKRSNQPIIILSDKKSDVTVPLAEFLINLESAQPSREQFVKLELSIHSTDKKADEIIAANLAQVRDAVIYVVHKKTPETLFEEKEGAFSMKEELKNRINEALGSTLIDDVYITNILMQ